MREENRARTPELGGEIPVESRVGGEEGIGAHPPPCMKKHIVSQRDTDMADAVLRRAEEDQIPQSGRGRVEDGRGSLPNPGKLIFCVSGKKYPVGLKDGLDQPGTIQPLGGDPSPLIGDP